MSYNKYLSLTKTTKKDCKCHLFVSYKSMYEVGIITARKRSLRRLCFHRCLPVHRGGGVQAQAQGKVSPQGVSMPRGVCLGGCPGPGPRGVSAWGRGLSTPRGVSQHALRQTPPPKHTATAAGSMHPTGMHSCYNFLSSQNTFCMSVHFVCQYILCVSTFCMSVHFVCQ